MKTNKEITIPLRKVEKLIKKFVIEECYGADFDMLTNEQTMKVFKDWWRKERKNFLKN